MKIEDVVYGKEAAKIMRLSRSDAVWRWVKQHAAAYQQATGRTVAIKRLGRTQYALRSELEAFAEWYHTQHRPPRVFDGPRIPNSRLTDEQVLWIKAQLQRGKLTHRQIGERVGVSAAHVSSIKNGRTWTHIPWPDEPLPSDSI